MLKSRPVRTLILSLSLVLFGCSKAAVVPAEEEPKSSGPEVVMGWESSGGDGVACFADEAGALQADRAGDRWPKALREKIVSVSALEHWEHRTKSFARWQGLSRDEILARMKARFEKYSPIFHSRLKLVESHIHVQQWKDQANLPDITDSTPSEAVAKADPKCRLVQLAVRHTRSIPGKLPEAWVEVDQFLFEKKMSALSQAVLVLHEQMYLLGREIGHKNSDFLRGVVADLFSDELAAALESMPKPSLSAHLLQLHLGSAYGDYYNFFLEDPATFLPVTPPGYHPYSRYRSFGTLLKRLRDRKGSCLDENDYDNQSEERKRELQETCSFYSVNPDLIKGLLTEEEAFLFLSRWLLDAVGAIDCSENFVVWDQASPTAETPYQKAELERACRHLAASDYVYFRPIVRQALGYCRAVNSL
jgi:hypothetical protein